MGLPIVFAYTCAFVYVSVRTCVRACVYVFVCVWVPVWGCEEFLGGYAPSPLYGEHVRRAGTADRKRWEWDSPAGSVCVLSFALSLSLPTVFLPLCLGRSL